MKKAIAYYRVSTDRQGKSGLSLDAQREIVTGFMRANGYRLHEEFIEIKKSEDHHRTTLVDALRECRENDALLVIAKLDRLSRDVAYIATLMKSKVPFRVVDIPPGPASRLFMHMAAAFAEYELYQIRERTRLALQAAKARGVVLGKYGREILSKINHRKALQFAQSLRPSIEQMRQKGYKTVRQIRDELNRLHIPTFRNKGQKWHIQTVYKILKRLNITKT